MTDSTSGADRSQLVGRHATLDSADVDADAEELLRSNHDDSPLDPSRAEFRPYEAVVYRL